MNVGIVGCGNIAAFHLESILRQDSVNVLSITDIDRHKSEEIGKRFGLRNVYRDFETMLKEQNLDVVHVLTPPATHAELAIKAMESGCHVLVEKPMALTVMETEAMIAAAKKNNVKLCVNHNLLLDSTVSKAAKLIQKGQSGRIVHVDASFSFDIKRWCGLNINGNSQTHWCLELPGGPLLDLIPHPLSVLLHFVKDPVKIWAVRKSNGILREKLPDEIKVLVETEEMTGFFSVSLAIRPDCFTVNIYATQMSIHINVSNMTLVVRKNRHVPKKIFRILDNIDQSMQLLSSTFSNVFKVFMGKIQPPGDMGSLITKFYESIRNNSELPVTGEDGKTVVRVMNEIWKQPQ